MAPEKEKDIVAPFIQGPSMDWTMDDGLYSHFQTWKISCNLILDSELCELSEVRKINTLLCWSSDFGIKKLKSWQKEPSQLTLNFIWGEYESYCKPQSNELRAWYDILKKLTQGSLPVDDWMTKLQSQLHLCNYKPEMEEVLLRDLFLFGLQDESFMSKIISEESPNVTIADINQVSHKPNEQELSQELETPKTITCKEDIRKYFPDVIDGKPYHINIDANIPPKWLPARAVPIQQQAEFKCQLQDMLDAGVIVLVTEPTPWINSFVIVETTDQHGNPKMCICLDPTPLNKAVIREPYHYRSPDDIYHHLCNAKYLTVIDFKKCYWQCLLNEESSYLTTFNTPYGRFRFVRLPFGVNVSGDAVQRKTDEIYNPLPNVIGIIDDIIIWGDKEDGSDHDTALAHFLQVTRKNGLRINFDKIQYKTTEVTFFGEIYTTKGHKPASDKVQAITQMPTPTNVTELQTFLGMCQYLAKYSPRIAELSEPLQ